MQMKLEVTKKQQAFMAEEADEVLFGGAAGGGKSWAQLIDALVYALRYAGSRQLVLRRSFPELEKSLIRGAMELYPRGVWRYNATKHTGRFVNGSVIDFGYCDGEADVYRYQSAEYDVIRFDELTHFPEGVYLYLHSRLRGANAFPKQMKSCSNPGGVGHAWVKARFIDPAPAGQVFRAVAGSRVFLPSSISDNRFLVEKDPGYVRRLENLPEREKKALLHGDWDIFEGQFFPEFSRAAHVCAPFPVPGHWKVYRALDYGLDMLACLWVAVDEAGHAYVVDEEYAPDLIISAAAARIRQRDAGRPVYLTLAPPDLWGRRQETGRSAADIFAENGVVLTRASNERVAGWLAVKEWLALRRDEEGNPAPRLRVFAGCRNLIRTLPALQADARNMSDAATAPHEVTHAPDALRYFCVWWTEAAGPVSPEERRWQSDLAEDWAAAGEEGRKLLEGRWGVGGRR